MKTEIAGNNDPDDDFSATQILDDKVLKDVVAYVEVRSTNDNRSQAICKELEALGARVSKKFTDDVTHVIYKEGSKRTRNKAQKRGVPLISVLWIESCKLNQSHVSERLYPALVQEDKRTPILITRLKKAKSMQPRNFEDDLASSAERCLKKRRKEELERLKSNENTPKFSPRLILALDTQKWSPEEGFVHTPIRLTIPDTPPSMRQKMERLKQGRINGSCTSMSDDEIQSSGEREPLQRQLFDTSECNVSSVECKGQASLLSQNICSTECDEDPLPAEFREPFESIQNQGTSHGITNSPLQHLSTCQSLPESTKRKPLGSKCNGNASINKSLNPSTENINTNDVINKCSHAVDSKICKCNENVKDGQKYEIQDQNNVSQHIVTENKKTFKKKLLSVEARGIPPEILIEPTKCSQYPSPALADSAVKGRRGRACGNSNTSIDTSGMIRYNHRKSQEIGENGVRKRKLNTEENDKDSSNERKIKKQRQNFNLQKTEMDGAKEDISCKSKCNEIISVQKETEMMQSNITDNSTMIDHSSCFSSTPEATMGLTFSTKETTLGLSLSTAFTDTMMTSIILPPRPSIDEFNPKKNKLKGMKQHFNDKNKKKENLLESDTCHRSNCRKSENKSLCERSYLIKTQGSSLSSIKQPTLVMTSLHSYEQDVVIAVVKKLGVFSITEKVCETTTHVVSGEPRRTLNILHGLARGCWIISKDWVLHSLEAGKWLKEDAFECNNDFPLCRITRKTREQGLPISTQEMFAELGPIFVSDNTIPPRKHLITLMRVCGGQITNNLSKARLYLGSDFHSDVTSLKPLWILDCVTEGKLLPMDRYILDKPKREDSPVY